MANHLLDTLGTKIHRAFANWSIGHVPEDLPLLVISGFIFGGDLAATELNNVKAIKLFIWNDRLHKTLGQLHFHRGGVRGSCPHWKCRSHIHLQASAPPQNDITSSEPFSPSHPFHLLATFE
jgi:hypothetical protein